jgi:hypothetical protein
MDGDGTQDGVGQSSLGGNSCAAAVAARASQNAPTENVLQTGQIRGLATCLVDIEKL